MSAVRSPSGEGPAPPRPALRLIAFVLLILAIRLVLAASLGLTEDEAYYRLWARAPAFGYFDHPPMIAWWIWLGQRVAGDDPLGVRLLACLACAATSFVVYDLARGLGESGRTAERAAVWWNSTLLVAAGGLLAVPDAPASLFWTLCLWAAARAWRARSASWWAAAGVCAGLAGLSKYSALFLAPGMFLWLASSREGRARLRSAGPWLALALAAAIFAVNVAWNAAHQWLTFAKQFGRITPHRFAPRYLAELVAAQALLLDPILAAFAARALARPGSWPARRLVLATTAPFALYLVLHSLHDRVQAHWPAPLYPGLALLAAAAAARVAGPAWSRLRRLAAPVGLGACVAAGAYLALPALGAPLAFDPAGPLRGWGAFAARIEDLRSQTRAGWIATTSYGLAAQLMDQRRITAPVWQVSERDRWRDLRTPIPDLARPGLVIDLSRRVDPVRLAKCFAHVRPLGPIVRGAPGERGARYQALLVSGARADLLARGC
jgi:4-amino-4-deoxy-L-arabinose transferase-like glycosyltransferase